MSTAGRPSRSSSSGSCPGSPVSRCMTLTVPTTSSPTPRTPCATSTSSPELTGIGEFDQAARVDGWTEAVINLLGDAHRWVGAWRRDGHDRLPNFTVEDLSSWRYDELVARALNVHP